MVDKNIFRKWILVLLSVLVWPMSEAALSQDEMPLTGRVFIASATPIDPPAGEKVDTHAYFSLEGDGAAAVYEAMPGPSEQDLCKGAGWSIKRSGSVSCSLNSETGLAACELSIDLVAGSLATGIPC